MGKIERIELPAGRIVSIKLREDGTYELLFEVEEQNSAAEIEVEADAPETDEEELQVFSESEIKASKLVLIEASKLSLDDEFMQHHPKSRRERKFRHLLGDVIVKGIPDFWRPRMDPTLDREGNIYFRGGEKPAVGKFYHWWSANAQMFNSKHKSRLGTKSEYIAFLGVLIKKLVAEGWTKDEAWDAVCNDSKRLGHYLSPETLKLSFGFTGSMVIAGFSDLANTRKILADDEDVDVFWIAGGCYKVFSDNNPLADFVRGDIAYGYPDNSVGWLVLS